MRLHVKLENECRRERQSALCKPRLVKTFLVKASGKKPKVGKRVHGFMHRLHTFNYKTF